MHVYKYVLLFTKLKRVKNIKQNNLKKLKISYIIYLILNINNFIFIYIKKIIHTNVIKIISFKNNLENNLEFTQTLFIIISLSEL